MLQEAGDGEVDRAADDPGAARGAPRPARRRRAGACSSAARSRAASSTAARSQALDPGGAAGRRGLTSLVRKELVRPDEPQLAGDDAFRFRHLLIRDAAYDALPKATRADLHERFADWLERARTGLVELDEILGYHLEQAYRYRVELGAAAERARPLGLVPRTVSRPPPHAPSYAATSGRRCCCSSAQRACSPRTTRNGCACCRISVGR